MKGSKKESLSDTLSNLRRKCEILLCNRMDDTYKSSQRQSLIKCNPYIFIHSSGSYVTTSPGEDSRLALLMRANSSWNCQQSVNLSRFKPGPLRSGGSEGSNQRRSLVTRGVEAIRGPAKYTFCIFSLSSIFLRDVSWPTGPLTFSA